MTCLLANGDYNNNVIGSLLHYNCAGSVELAVCTQSFVYEGPKVSNRYGPGDTLIVVEWVTPVPASKRPSGIVQNVLDQTPTAKKCREAYPPGEEYRVWYNFKWFKELSSI